MSHPLEALLGAAARRQRPTPPVMSAELLQEFQQRYADWISADSPLKSGQLVKFRADAPYGGSDASQPIVVLETRPVPAPDFLGEEGDISFGARLDCRVALFQGEKIHLVWVESHSLELWDTEK